MSKMRLKCLGLVLLLPIFGGCESVWDVLIGEEKPKVHAVVVKTPVQQPQPNFPKPDDVERDCQEFLKSHKSLKGISYPHAKSVKFELVNDKVSDNASLVSWLDGFSKTIFETKACPWDKVQLLAAVDQDKFYQGVVYKQNFKLYQQDRISQAEWFRRFEVKEIQTDSSIKNQIKKARYKHEHATALSLVNGLLDSEPDNLDLKLLKANIYRDQNSIFEALSLYEQVVKTQPKYLLALFNLAYTQKLSGNFTASIQTYLKVQIEMKETSELWQVSSDDVWMALGDAYLKNRELKKAKDSFDQVTDQDNSDLKIFNSNLLRSQKKYEQAKEILDAMVLADTADAMVKFNLVLLHLDLKDAEGAKTAYQNLKQVSSLMAKELEFISIFKTESKDDDVVEDEVKPKVSEPSSIDGINLKPIGPMGGETEQESLF